MMAQWQDAYRQVTQKLRHLSENAPTQLWQNVFTEALKRWQNRQDFADGKIGSEVTVKINVTDEPTADKALQRIADFSRQFGNVETDAVQVIMLGQKYRKDGNIAVLLRIRIAAKTAKNRSKFVANPDEI
jgi:hypothetical protein